MADDVFVYAYAYHQGVWNWHKHKHKHKNIKTLRSSYADAYAYAAIVSSEDMLA